MGGCRPPQAAFRLVVDHSLPPMENPKTVFVDKIVKDDAEIFRLETRLKSLTDRLETEGRVNALLSQSLAEKPREIVKRVEVEVEKVVYTDEIVFLDKIVYLDKIVMTPVSKKLLLALISVGLLVGFTLGALV